MVGRGNKKKRLILFAYIIAVFSTIISASGLLVYGRISSEKLYKANVEQVLHTVSNIVDDKINSYEAAVNTIVNNSNLVNLASVKRDMEILTENDDTLLNIYFVDAASGSFTGALDVVFEDITDARVDMEWYPQVTEDPEHVFLSEVYDDELTGKPTVTLMKAAVKDGVTYGALGIDIDLTHLREELSVFKYGETGEIEVIDDFGTVAIHRDQSKIGSDEPTKYSVWNDILNNESGKVEFEYDSVDYEGYYAGYDRMYWKLLIKNDVNELRADERAQGKIILGVAAVALALETLVFMQASKKKKR